MPAGTTKTSMLPLPLQVTSDEDFTADVWATAMLYLIQRIAAIESFEPSYEAAIDNLNRYGLARLNDVLLPLYQQVSSIGSLGAIFSCQSNTQVTVGVNQSVVFYISDKTQQSTFSFSAYMVATDTSNSRAVGGFIKGYDRANGLLTMQVTEAYGQGVGTAWLISPSSPPLLSAAVVDGGDIDAGTTGATSLPYSYSGSQPTSATGSVTLAQFKRALGPANLAVVAEYIQNNYNIYDDQYIEWANGYRVPVGGIVYTMVKAALGYTTAQMTSLISASASVVS